MKPLAKFITIAVLSLILCLSLPVNAKQPIDNPNSAIALIGAGKQYYHAGQFSDAAIVLQQAAQQYAVKGNAVKQAQSLSLLSLAYQQLGQLQLAEKAIADSLALLATIAPEAISDRSRAQILNHQGRFLLSTGKIEPALDIFQASELLYRQAEDKIGVIGSQIARAQALQHLGFYRRAQQLFTQIEQQLATEPDSLLKLKSWHNLGNISRQSGDLERSQEILQRSLVMLEKLIATQPSSRELSQIKSQILFSLANTERALAQRAEARQDLQQTKAYQESASIYYQQAAVTNTFPLVQVQAKLNQLSLLIATELDYPTHALLTEINSLLPQLPLTRSSLYAKVNYAGSLMQLKNDRRYKPKIVPILQQAVREAQKLEDLRAKSYALGTLGKFYERQANWLQAKKYTLDALLIAQTLNAPDIAYQWQWQMGRILTQYQTGDEEAVKYYTQAFNTLNELRSDIIILNPEIQFSFRESVEPVYRQLVDLLLRSPQPSKENLIQARNVMEALQLAELDNFFRDACATPQTVDIDNLDATAAVVYPIILENRLEIIVKLAGVDNLRHYVDRDVSATEIDRAVRQFRQSLTRRSTSLNRVKQQSQQIYHWLIEPLEIDLGKEIKTLVFVLDGSLRNLPMAALYDGKQYLIEKYAVAVTPGLQLLEPRSLLPERLNILLAGATNAPSFRAEGLAPLDNVRVELTEVAQIINKHQKLTEQNFLQQNLDLLIDSEPFNVVHLATHGSFSSNPDRTYLLDWQQRIGVKDLDNLLRTQQQITTPIELLVLSACETASGDRRAALGLAGIAIRARTRSTLATLWQVNDASTAEFMIQFYQKLKNPQVTKAEALRQTQLAFLNQYSNTDYNRPYHWAAFVLVGNWL